MKTVKNILIIAVVALFITSCGREKKSQGFSKSYVNTKVFSLPFFQTKH